MGELQLLIYAPTWLNEDPMGLVSTHIISHVMRSTQLIDRTSICDSIFIN